MEKIFFKYLRLIFIPALMLAGCLTNEHDPAEIQNSEIELSDLKEMGIDSFIFNHYLEDAKQLYMHEIIRNKSHPNYDVPEFNNTEIYKILRIIQAVYNSHSAERDMVFEKYNIHTWYCYSFNSIILQVNAELPEIQNLARGIIPTGDQGLDNLLSEYAFDSVRTSYGYPEFPWLSVNSSAEYNLIPIVEQFNGLPSVGFAESNGGCGGDGNNIKLERDNDSALITFSTGWGDCPAGCIYHEYREFRVVNNNAEFIRTYSD